MTDTWYTVIHGMWYVQILWYMVCADTVIRGMYRYCDTWYVQILWYVVCTDTVIHGMCRYCDTWYVQILWYMVCAHTVIHGMCTYCDTWYVQILWYMVWLCHCFDSLVSYHANVLPQNELMLDAVGDVGPTWLSRCPQPHSVILDYNGGAV